MMQRMMELTVLILCSAKVLHSTGYSLGSTRTDLSGTYYFDSQGYKIYSRCRDSQAYTGNHCRSYSFDRYEGTNRYNTDRYDRDRYNSVGSSEQKHKRRQKFIWVFAPVSFHHFELDKNRYISGRYHTDRFVRYDQYEDYSNQLRGKVNVGDGSYRLVNGGRDVELICEFPLGRHIISNIVWIRDDGYDSYRGRSSSLSDRLGRRMKVEDIGNYGSALTIRDYEERDASIYRCEATRSYETYRGSYGNRHGDNRPEDIYMEVEFQPQNSYLDGYRGNYYNSGRYDSNRRPYSNYNNRDNYYFWRTSEVKTEEDTIVKSKSPTEGSGITNAE